MADLSVGTVTKIYGGQRVETAGGNYTQGQAAVRHLVDGLWYPAVNDTAEHAHSYGIFLTSGAAQSAAVIQTSGAIDLGVAGTLGQGYWISANAGGLCPSTDLTSGKYATFMMIYVGQIGLAQHAYLLRPLASDIAHA
ncbi:MAG: hypothetical protein KGL39_10750 [Patescibacteria group bacterium]|nr:hypothetical protein [Patescibacteria group bacterium]